jgi:hypothetical protein
MGDSCAFRTELADELADIAEPVTTVLRRTPGRELIEPV